MKKTIKLVWHPESPGMKMFVYRTWWQRLWRPKDFATLGEVLRHADKKLSLLDEREIKRREDLRNFNERDLDAQYPMRVDECYPTKLD